MPVRRPRGRRLLALAVAPAFLAGLAACAGTPDPGFGSGGYRRIDAPLVESPRTGLLAADGSTYLASGDTVEDVKGASVRKVDAAGVVDPAYGGDGTAETGLHSPFALEATGAGLLVAGNRSTGDFTLTCPYCATVTRLTGSGGLDPAFGGDGLVDLGVPADESPTELTTSAVQSLTHDPATGAVYAAGFVYYNPYGGGPIDIDEWVARLLPDGSLDTAFGAGGFVRFEDVTYGSTRVLWSGGSLLVLTTDPDELRVQRYTAGGALDPSFGAGGTFTQLVGTSAAPHTADFAPGTTGSMAIAVGDDDLVLVYRVSATGTLDAGPGTLDAAPGSAEVTPVRDVLVDPQGRVVIAGSVGDAYGPSNEMYVARATPALVADTAFSVDGAVVSTFANHTGAIALGRRVDGRLLAIGSRLAIGPPFDTPGWFDLWQLLG